MAEPNAPERPRESPSIAAVLLAAGGGSRFEGDTHKLLAPFRQKTVFAWALGNIPAEVFDDVIVVTGAVDLADHLPAAVVQVHNPRWADGQATSLHLAVEVAADRGHDAVVVGLGDQPMIPADAWRVIATDGAAPIIVATYDGRRRNPVRLARSVWHLLPTSGDNGARVLLRKRPDLVLEQPCPGNPGDIDTLEDLATWN